MASEAEQNAQRYIHSLLWGSPAPPRNIPQARIATFQPPSATWSPSKPIGTTTYIDYKNHQQGDSWRKKASSDCFRLVGYYQAERDDSERLQKSWIHHGVVNAFRFALSGRTVRFEGDEIKISLKDPRVNVSDFKEPNPCRRITGELDLVFYDTERQRYFFVDVKTVHTLSEKNLSDAVLKVRVAQQLRVYALLLKWAKNLDYMPAGYVLGLHVKDRGKTGYWELINDYRPWNTIEEAIRLE